MARFIIIYLSCLVLSHAQLSLAIQSQFSSIDADEYRLLRAIEDEKLKQKLAEEQKIAKEQRIIDEQLRISKIKEEKRKVKLRDKLKVSISKLSSEKENLSLLLAKEKKLSMKKEERAKKRKRNRIVAHIDLSSQRMKVYQGEKLLHKWRVSTARKGYRTPVGKYTPQYLAKMHYSSLYHNSPMPYTVFFSGNYAIHGTNSISRLGTKASHGCVRLHPKNAKVLYSMIRKYGKDNTEIKITY